MFDVMQVARQLKSAVLADPERFYSNETGAWVAGLPRPQEIRVVTGREPFWINLGYWRDVERVDETNCERVGDLFKAAQAQMAHLLARTARLSERDVVLDCGFGYADQDILWAEEYRPARIVGINVTPNQVRVGKERVKLTGLEERVRLEVGSATQIPFGDGEFDVVFALESAMHFRTRGDFLREAFRVLRPGGRLVMADMCQKTDRESGAGLRRRLRHRYWRGRIAFPEANVWTTQRYLSELHVAGFQQGKLESIASDVYPAVNTALAALRGMTAAERQPGSVTVAKVREDVRRARQMEFEQLQWLTLFNCDEYAVVSAEKP
ncbi:class I SAM-dependent methyltransferase [Myxococcus sp. K38C18041901]|uniref:SAM-dependent methyltransferase n=1 Tax=Myxococcus guangdongensis TaxID=2906760 RepID=UPI0020A8239A|nr:class I SAM-dependent methyltransferase [Myxococcus guangdongensis]MCP3064909.1 class I SAM-dependent methyltransferase [Myxococcus guangdongensis]